MKIADILKRLDEIAPFETQEKWDNSGLLIGDMERRVESVVLSLDIDRDVIEKAPQNSLIITHHPLIFSGIKSLNFSKYPSNLIELIVKKGIQLISLHTNFDKAILNRYVLETILGWKVKEELDDFILVAEVDSSGEAIFEHIKERLNLPYLRYTEIPHQIKRVALTTGSGASLKDIVSGKVDLFLTGDIKYHEAFEAKSINLPLLDIGHFESEIGFADSIKPYLDELNLDVQIINSSNPFQVDF